MRLHCHMILEFRNPVTIHLLRNKLEAGNLEQSRFDVPVLEMLKQVKSSSVSVIVI